jgi:class 3 adenylate cyclase/uncharacterized protein YcbX
MHCPACGADSADGKRFCADCGAALPVRCPQCHAESPPDKSFCADCGAALGVAAARQGKAPSTPPDTERLVQVATESSEPPAGERKTVTALFADIKSSMELIEDLDPEQARAIVDPALHLMIDAVRHYDGYVAQSTGDGIFALFGAPLAHEDHPQRALYAALRIQAELKRYSDRIRADGHVPIQGRVGVNGGDVVVRSIQIGDAHTEYVPIGHSISLAARMQALAPIGSIATTETVRRLGEGYFVFKDLGPTRVKGVSEPIHVFEVTGIGPLRTRLQRSVGRGLTKFVGREREMAALATAAAQARTGHGQIVAAMAEAGTGKSRLFFEFIATARTGWLVLETLSVSHGKASPDLPLIDLLHGYFGIEASDDSRKRREKVAGKIAILDRALEDALPYLFDLLAISDDDDALAQLDESLRRRRTHEAIKRLLLRESLDQPVMLVFEDLHWIDTQTQAFLNLLADSIGTARLLLLVNYRPGYTHPWSGKTYYTQVPLDPLERVSAQEMLTALLGRDDDLAALQRLIIEKTEGTPFFMEEMVQMLFDDGTLARDGAVKLTRPLDALKIPTTVQAILAARIDRLPPEAKALLQLLAVIGREFPLSLVRELAALSDDSLDRLLDHLQLGEFIYEQPAVGGTQYTFKHALTQDVAYQSVLMERRKALHERIGATIERMYAGSIDDHLNELAHHYGRSGNVDAGMKYLTHAGKQKMDEARRAGATDVTVATIPTARPAPGTSTSNEPVASIDSVAAIWRYPVKSMAGEEVSAAQVTAKGLLGDRVYAWVETASNRAAAVRTWATTLLNYHPRFVTEPEDGAPAPALQIRLPSGELLSTADPGIERHFSALLGRNLTLMSTAPAGLTVEAPAGTVGGAFRNATELPIGGGAPAGSFVDYGCIHVIATSTIEHLQQAYPQGRFDVRRFRPNVVVQSQGAPFVENSWVGRTLAIGDEVVLRITIPCPRCITMTLAQGDLPRDPRVLRTVAEHNMCELGEFGTLPCAGVYADVVRSGRIRRGDAVVHLD